MKIGYAKLGRSWKLNPADWSSVGGDVDVWNLLHKLACERPDDTFVLVGRNSGEVPQDVGLPANVVNPWIDWKPHVPAATTKDKIPGVIAAMDEVCGPTFETLDAIIVWCGQHGTSNSPIPPTDSEDWGIVTNPQVSFVNYGSYLVRGINRWRRHDPITREEVWLCPDVRNYVKARDLKNPLRHPVLAQFDRDWQTKHERYGDQRSPEELGFKATWEHGHWVTRAAYRYSGLELTALPRLSWPSLEGVERTSAFGMLVNENRRQVTNDRLGVYQRWVHPFFPTSDLYGKWHAESQRAIGREVDTIPVSDVIPTMARWRSTLTTPASGSGWATAKPWEAYAAGTVCFFHPQYDTQGHILPTLAHADELEKRGLVDEAQMVRFLRPATPETFAAAVQRIANDDAAYEYVRDWQRTKLIAAMQRDLIGTLINERLST